MPRVLLTLFVVLLYCHTPVRAQNVARYSDIKPGMYDELLAQQALKIANERALNYRCPERYTKALILSYKWHVIADKSGFIKGRKIHMELYCERPDGTCAMSDFTFMEKHIIDNEFSDRLIFVRNGNLYKVDCE